MSAIAGIYQMDREHVLLDDCQALMRALHRYPCDSVQDWYAGQVFLGCHAQWITPESINEQLPCYHSELQLAITADAILDNRQELFERLQIEPARRLKMPDSELILLAYHRWGFETPKFLVGDYALVIWDERNKMMFGARDLLGNRSLYYNLHEGRFAFSTVISPLLHLPGIKKQLNEAWMAEFLAIPIMLDAVEIHGTSYRGIYQLPPAHRFTVSDGKLSVSRYEVLTAPSEQLRLRSNGEYVEAFREVFQTAVNSRLRTFRQVGAALSGGLDSGSVVSFAANALKKEGKILHTFSYVPVSGFTDWTPWDRVADERPYIQATVEHVGNIQDNYLDLPDKNPVSEINDWLELLEMPYKFFENSYWIRGINEKARQSGIGVLLSGAWGNTTISWGSAWDYYAILLRKLRFVQFYRELKLFSRNMGIGRSRLLPVIGKCAFPFLDRAASPQYPEIPLMIHPEYAQRTKIFEKLRDYDIGLYPSGADVLEARINEFGNLAHSNMQGISGTKLSLRYGQWDRDPTCDPRVVRFCLSLPIEQYVQNGMDRALIRRSTESYLPDKVRLNQRIRGVQGVDWVYRLIPVWRTIADELRQLCRDPVALERLNVDQVKQSLAKFGDAPKPEHAIDPEARFLMRTLIAYRFLKQFA
ncbi:asparagine synthase-related protein [Paenibacillus tarimensis]